MGAGLGGDCNAWRRAWGAAGGVCSGEHNGGGRPGGGQGRGLISPGGSGCPGGDEGGGSSFLEGGAGGGVGGGLAGGGGHAGRAGTAVVDAAPASVLQSEGSLGSTWAVAGANATLFFENSLPTTTVPGFTQSADRKALFWGVWLRGLSLRLLDFALAPWLRALVPAVLLCSGTPSHRI